MTDDNAGSSVLTEGGDAQVEQDGNPAGELNAAQQALADAQEFNDIPEYIPEKFWDKQAGKPKIEEMGRSYKSLVQLLGREKVPVPVDDDDEEGWERWYAATGRPEAPDKYEFERPDLPQDLPYDEESENAFRTWAHVNGLNKKQAKNLYDAYVKTQIERHAAWNDGQKQARAKIEHELRREYGDKYDGAVASAKAAIQKYADPDFKAYLDQTGHGNDPRMIRIFAKIGKEMQGETRQKNPPRGESAQGTPADLDTAIANFRDKFKDALFNKEHPNHELRVKEYNKLFEARYGDQR